jgi:hypothetical protein
MTIWLRRRLPRRADPDGGIAAWEYEVDADLAAHLAAGRPLERAYRPSYASNVPDGAISALTAAIGPLSVRDLFVVPASTRPAGYVRSRRRHVFTPTRILGVGRRGVGLWVDGLPEPRVWMSVAYPALAAIVERRLLLSNVVAVHAPGCHLPLRYHAVGPHRLDDLVIRARREAAGDALPVPAIPVDPDGLPPHWRAVLSSTVVRLDARTPVSAVFGRAPSVRGWRLRECLVALTPYELVVVCTPQTHGASGGYATDRLYAPRRQLRRVDVTGGGGVHIDSAGASLGVRIPPSMVPAVRSLLAPVCASAVPGIDRSRP